jgi:uncharacterized lipoprotein
MIRALSIALVLAAVALWLLVGCTSYNRESAQMLADWQAALAAEEATP